MAEATDSLPEEAAVFAREFMELAANALEHGAKPKPLTPKNINRILEIFGIEEEAKETLQDEGFFEETETFLDLNMGDLNELFGDAEKVKRDLFFAVSFLNGAYNPSLILTSSVTPGST